MKLLIILIIAISTAYPCVHIRDQFNCVKYVKNYDGDTITFDIPKVHPLLGKGISIRVFGIDTPEIRGKTDCEKSKARKARSFVYGMMYNAKRITLKNAQRGKYFRIVAEVWVDGKSVADELIKAKLAVPYDGGTKQDVNWCK